jgi:hypothetical protein
MVLLVPLILAAALLLLPSAAHASLFQGETLDKVADAVAWVALIIVPIAGIVVFWIVHILPEKIAEKKQHPQTKAIQMLCLLSLVFGGMLWPIAWLWATTKPVLYKSAYGTDVWDEDPHKPKTAPPGDVPVLTSEAEVAAVPRQRG